jgi:hypothetical protein
MARALLQKFVRNGGVVLEGRGQCLAAAAAALLAAGATVTAPPAVAAPKGRTINSPAIERTIQALYGRELPDLPSMGILHDASHPKVKNFTRANDPALPASGGGTTLPVRGERAATFDYSAVIQDIQKQVDREFRGRIHIVDRSKPIAAELADIAALTGKPLKDDETFILGGDPHTSPARGPKATVCLVIGPPPGQDAHDVAVGFVEEMLGTTVAFKSGSGITDETWHRFALWHEVGHCLLGSSEAKADAFGVLKTVSESRLVNFLDDLTVVRELMERISTPTDEHIISPTLRQLPDRYAAGGACVDAGRWVRELGQITHKLQTHGDTWTILLRNRLAFTRYDAKKQDFDFAHAAFLVPVKEGYVATNFRGWLDASAAIPEVARIEQLIGYLAADPTARKIPGAFSADRAASATAVAALARAGHPVARDSPALFGAAPSSSDLPLENGGLPAASQIEGRLIAFDRSSAVVKFAKDLRSFLVRDAVTKRPILAGNARDGVTKMFGASHAPMHTADRNIPSPRF